LNLEAWGLAHLDWAFFLGVLNIVLIDIILAGDNAVVIAMAVRSLPRRQRLKGIVIGAAAAVILRVVLTFFVAQLLGVYLLKFIGGAFIVWIAVKLFVEGAPQEEGKEAAGLAQAVRLIVVADITMSLDNVLAVAGASQGHFSLLIFGLALSIPFVVFTSNLLSYLMDRYPVIIYLGAAVLGRVAGEMMMGDPLIVDWLQPSQYLSWGVQAFLAGGVIVAGKLLIRRKFRTRSESVAQP
jgi:YjbE family integral membrane protein